MKLSFIIFILHLQVGLAFGVVASSLVHKESDKSFSHRDFHAVFNISYCPALQIPEKYAFVVNKEALLKSKHYLEKKRDNEALARRYGPSLKKNKHAPFFIRYINKNFGYGLFADKNIERGELIGEYTGKLIQSHETSNKNAYLFTYPGVYFDKDGKKCTFYIDAQDQGNALRFVNHSDSCTNVDVVQVPYQGRWYIVYVANKAIPQGTQFLVNYGDAYWAERKKAAPLAP